MKFQILIISTLLFIVSLAISYADPMPGIEGITMPPDDGKLRIICFGAHPDDCEIRAAGCGAMWAAQGHHVLFVSMTNGDIGHWREAGGPLAQPRKIEVDRVHESLGIQGVVLDIHDGELMPTLENRRTVTRLIRQWKADVVISHRPNDYHPDHRYTGVLVQDAAFMVVVPFFCPDIPFLKTNPVFLYYPDRFQKPSPFRADVIVSIDEVIEKKLDAMDMMVSQFYEGGALGSPEIMPADSDKAAQERRKKEVRTTFTNRFKAVADDYRKALEEWYPADQVKAVRFAEAFELCEYGSQPGKQRLRELFPFFK